jgi:hypothetical protein
VVTWAVARAARPHAQISALVDLFYSRGWRKATALLPVYEMPDADVREA